MKRTQTNQPPTALTAVPRPSAAHITDARRPAVPSPAARLRTARLLALLLALLICIAGCANTADDPDISLPPDPSPADQPDGTLPAGDQPEDGVQPTGPVDPPAPEEPDGMPSADATMTGLVVESNGSTFLLVDDTAASLCVVPASVPVYDAADAPTTTVPAVGQLVEVGYSGSILETYPAQLGGTAYIRLLGQTRDTFTLYRQVFDDLWQTDPALNADVEIISFDLQGAANLNDVEKTALTYLIGRDYGKEVLLATHAELREQGYITEADGMPRFENGIAFSFSVSEDNGDTFTFTAEKWRSALGAYFFSDCTATRTAQGWQYEIGSEMIA